MPRFVRPSAVVRALSAAAVLVLVPALGACASQGGPLPHPLPPGVDEDHVHFSEPSVEVGATAPDFELPAANGGEPLRLGDFRGRPLVLLFGSFT